MPWVIGVPKVAILSAGSTGIIRSHSQASDVGEEEKVVGMDNRRRYRRQSVIVTELYLLHGGCRQPVVIHQEEATKTALLRGSAVLTETETVSFSFTMGTTPICSSSEKVFCAFRYRVR